MVAAQEQQSINAVLHEQQRQLELIAAEKIEHEAKRAAAQRAEAVFQEQQAAMQRAETERTVRARARP